jgi:hypothetical protein
MPASLQRAANGGRSIMKIRKHNRFNRKHGFKPAFRKDTLSTSSRANAERKAG